MKDLSTVVIPSHSIEKTGTRNIDQYVSIQIHQRMKNCLSKNFPTYGRDDEEN